MPKKIYKSFKILYNILNFFSHFALKLSSFIFIFTILAVNNIYSNISINNNENLNRKLLELEQIYNSNRFEEAINKARLLMIEASQNQLIKQKAYDILILSLEKLNAERNKLLQAEENKRKQALASENFEKGTKYLAERNYQQAIISLKNAVNTYGGDADTWFYLGYAYKNIKNYEEAYKAFLQAIKINSNHLQTLYNISELAYRQNKFLDAEKYSKKLIDLLEKQIEELQTFYERSTVQNIKDKELEIKRKIKSYEYNLFRAYIIYGVVSKTQKNFENAKSVLLKAYKINNSHTEVNYHLADVYFNIKSYYQASLYYEQAIALYELKLRDVRTKAKNLLKENKPDEAVELEILAQKIEKRIQHCYLNLALCFWHRQEISTAIDTINKALEINKDFTKARLIKIIFQTAKKDYINAISEARTILSSSQPNSYEAKQAIKIIKYLMEKLAPITSDAFAQPPSSFIKFKPAAKTIYTPSKYLKELNGIDGKEAEKNLQPIIQAFEQINFLISRKNIPEAARILQELEKNFKDVSEIPKALGWCYVQMSRFEDGIEAYKKALNINPLDSETMANLAYLYALKARNLDEAINLANKAIANNPNRYDFYFTRGLVYFKLGELNKAIKDFELTLQHMPQHLLSIYNSGIAYYLLNNFEAAEKYFTEAIKNKPNFIKAKVFLALTHLKLQKKQQAIKTLEEVLSNIPKNNVTYKILFDLTERIKFAVNTNSSINLPHIKTTVPINKMLKQAMEYRSKGFLNKAKDIYLQIQKLAPNCYEAYYELGDLYASRGFNAQAIKSWEQARNINPNDFKLLVNMAKAKYKLGYKEDAKNDFNKALGLNPKHPEPMYYLGLIAYENKNYYLSESYALKAVTTNIPYLKAWALLGLSRIKLGKYKLARDAYETLYIKAPSSSSLKRHARKKLWEIAQILYPQQFASFDHVKQVGQEITEKLTQSQLITPSKGAIFDPSQANKLLTFTQPSTKERIFISKKIAELKAKAIKYKAPPLPMTSKYQLPPNITPKRKPDPADPQIKEANDLALKGFISNAIEVLQKAKQISPNNFELLINLAFFHLLLGNYKDAFDEIASCVTVYPENPLARLFLGNMYWLGGMPLEAAEQWQYVNLPINIKDNNLLFYNVSEISWKNIKETTINDPDPSSNLAIIYLFTGKLNESIAESSIALSFNPDQTEHIYYQAMASVILYLKSKIKHHKKRALELITTLEFSDPSFPHLQNIKNYVSKL